MDEDLLRRAKNILEKYNISEKKKELDDLENKTYEESFWKDTKNSSEVLKKISNLRKEIEDIEMIPDRKSVV